MSEKKRPDDFESPKPRQAPPKTLVDAVVDGALKMGSSMVSLLSGLLAAALILYGGYAVSSDLKTQAAASSSSWELLQYKPEIIDDAETPLYGASLGEINEDYRAWLTVYDSSIDYPVMQGKDDLYYASHDIYKQASLTGAIYLAAQNSGDFSDSYNLIYGHHMDNGAMFGGLDSFKGDSYFDSHRTGIIITRSGAFDIEFFAVASTDAYEDRIYTVGDRMDDVIKFLRSGGADGVGVGTQVLQFDESVLKDGYTKIVALSTCASAETSGRLVVFGKLTPRTAKTVDLTVSKVWEDADDQDGLRPESLTLTLLSNGTPTETTVTLSDDNKWTAELTGLPMYDTGEEITYSWDEGDVKGYELTVESDDYGTNITLTNTHEPETVDLYVEKIWDDAADQDGVRPTSLSVTLYANGKELRTEVLTEANGWSATVDGLPKYEAGELIVYTWTEPETIDGYTAEEPVISEDGTSTTFTNMHETDTTVATVIKVWDDDNNQDGARPASLKVELLADGEVIDTVTLNEGNKWRATVEKLPKNADGKAISYTWREESLDGYTPTTKVSGSTTTITNTYAPTTTSFSVRKRWIDSRDQFGNRPNSLTVTLYADGVSTGRTLVLNDDNDWRGTIDDVPLYNDGKEIIYTWVEDDITGYRLSSTTFDGTYTVLENTQETTRLTVRKRWADNNNADGTRPASLTVYLLANGAATGTSVTLNEANNWTARVDNIPLYRNGRLVTYSWQEPTVNGYRADEPVTQGTTTTLTNRRVVTPRRGPYRLTIYYRYLNGGEAAPTYTDTLWEGDPYSITSPVIPGYRTATLVVAGTMPGRDVEYVVIYIPAGNGTTIITDYETPLGLGEVFINVGDCFE